MIRAEGRVVGVEGDQAVVEIPERAAACGNCKSADGCHSGLLGLSGGARTIRVVNRIGARVDDRVSLGIADGGVLRATWLSYLLPALLGIAGAAMGQSLGGDPGAVGGTLLGLAAGFVHLNRAGRRANARGAMISLERPQSAACHWSESQ